MQASDDADRAEKIAHELAACRQRGIEGLDRITHNQKPVAAPQLELLADGYAAVRQAERRRRKDKIKDLLRDALSSFDRSDPDNARLIGDLFFGSDARPVRRGPSELLKAARQAYGEPSETRFREIRSHAFHAFAEFLIGFAEKVSEAPGSDNALSPDPRGYTADEPSQAGTDRLLDTPGLGVVLRFSYRDLGATVAVTIEEHQRIIEEHGRCWWGWFKADYDDDHTPAMAELLRNCEVGLWERIQNLFYVAQCDNVVVGDGSPIQSPDKDLTPAYYRHQSYPAWLRLRSIRESSRQEFGDRFGDLPSTQATVYWGPEPRLEPVVVQAGGRSILHLADLRFGRYHRWSTAAAPRRSLATTEQAIARALRVRDIDLAAVGVVVMCGNFASSGPTEYAYKEALAFIDGLCEQLPHVGRESVVIVPGADDFARPGDREHSEQGLYREFHKNLYGAEEVDLIRIHRYEFTGFRVNVLPVNSVRRMLGVGERDSGLFGYTYDAQFSAMGDDYLRNHRQTRVINVVAAHHHLISTPVELPSDPQIPIPPRFMLGIHDAGRVLDKLSDNRVALFLHGHLPQARYRIVTSDDGWQTAVCGAGTAGASGSWLRQEYRDSYANSLALYDIEEDRIRGRVMVYDETFRRDPPPREFEIKI